MAGKHDTFVSIVAEHFCTRTRVTCLLHYMGCREQDPHLRGLLGGSNITVGLMFSKFPVVG